MNSYLEAIKSIKIPTSPPEIWAFINSISFPVAVLAIGLIVLFAIQGYKIFKTFLYVASCVAFAFVGNLYLGPLAAGFVNPYIPATFPIDIGIIVALICALIAFLITKFAYKLMIFLLGGGVGYALGHFYVTGFLASKLPSLAFLSNWLANIIVGIVLGLMCALFFVIAFKHIYIIGFSVFGMAGAGYILYKLIIGAQNNIVLICFVSVAAIAGIFAARHQYIEDDKATQFYF